MEHDTLTSLKDSDGKPETPFRAPAAPTCCDL